MTCQYYDVIILGGGCSGLAIGYYYSLLKSNQRIAILEMREQYHDDRSWCFWLTERDFVHQDIICKRWSKWLFSHNCQTVSHEADTCPYGLIKSIDYYQKTTHAILNDHRQELHPGIDVKAIEHKRGYYEITTSSGLYRASSLIDTRPDKLEVIKKARLYQIFYGLEIKTNVPVFDTGSVMLMSNLSANEEFCQFDYMLPIAENHALLEVTRFSKTLHSPHLLKAACETLLERWTQDYEICREEAAVLPMGIPLQKQPPSTCFNLSQHYGSLRASSGYGFLRLQAQAQTMAHHIANQTLLRGANVDNALDRWMDACFCRVLSRQMTHAPDVFMQMAKTLSAENFARFMNGAINWSLRWQVVKAMPTGLFVRALL
ncbi:Lycopene cyclase protein [Legionella geestiana]|uniref:Lycopene cyclase protein n=2 Tax=Legionella geestiana TaxID=45065 RepID=A0A0W0TPG3_9GAMM|nr:lycopene cyclase family protein [Legionella geestiana]KTC97488.1 Lycopene cyclase protein [Legionella geestiana]STX54166.1 lycopene cyclase family protein [Legionella geestiana]